MRWLLTLLTAVPLLAMSNLEVAVKAEQAVSGYESSDAKVLMTLINANGQKSVREMRFQHIELEEGDRSIITFLKPSDVKGTKLLSHEQIGGDDRQWIYLPALKRVKKIAGRNRSGAFMASEFSYEDIASTDYRNYAYSGDAVPVSYEGAACLQGERLPKAKDSGYTKQVVWVDSREFLVRKTEYYDRKQSLLKTAYFDGYKKIKGVWRIGKIHIVNHQTKKQTILEWVEDDVRAGLGEDRFDKRQLK